MKKKAKAVKRKPQAKKKSPRPPLKRGRLKPTRRGALPRAQTKPRKKKEDGFKLNFVRIGEGNWEKNPHVWQLQDVLSWEGTCMLTATQKSGKTWLALEMAVSTSSGVPFLGKFPVHKTGTVLIYSPELKQSELEARIAEICGRRGLDPTALNILIDSKYGLRLELDEVQGNIAENIARIHPAMVIFDPLKHCYGGGLRSEPKVKKTTDFLVHLSREYKCAVVLAHHSAKSARGHQFGGQGSSTWGTFAASNLSLKSIGDPLECCSILGAEQRHGAPLKLYLRLDGVEGKENRCIVVEEANAIKEERKLCADEKMEKAMLGFLIQHGIATFNQIDEAVPGRRITKLRLLHGLKKTKAILASADDRWDIFREVKVVPVYAHSSDIVDKRTGSTALGVDKEFYEAIAEDERAVTPLDIEMMRRNAHFAELEVQSNPVIGADVEGMKREMM